MDTGPELSPQPAFMHTDSETGLQLAEKHTDLEPGTQLPPEMHNDPKPELLAVPLHSDTESGQATVQEEKPATSPQKPGGSLFQRDFIMCRELTPQILCSCPFFHSQVWDS